jgi:hypothetical protein
VSGPGVGREILLSPSLAIRKHTRVPLARKLIESACDAEKEWRFGPADILRRLPPALCSLCFE